jgi:hypothetical protein
LLCSGNAILPNGALSFSFNVFSAPPRLCVESLSKNTTAQQASAGLHYFHKHGAEAHFQTTYIVEFTILGASSTHVKRSTPTPDFLPRFSKSLVETKLLEKRRALAILGEKLMLTIDGNVV